MKTYSFLFTIASLFALYGCTRTSHLENDLAFIYHTLYENHLGVHNSKDPEFKKWLENGFKKAQQELTTTSNDSEKREIITRFIKSFEDNHLSLTWKNNIFSTNPPLSSLSVSIENLTNEITWITLPTFQFNETQRAQFNAILAQLPHVTKKQALIFDMRGNGGGNSAHGRAIAEALFGKEYVLYKKIELFKNTSIDWRASKENKRFLERNVRKNSFLRKIVEGMEISLRNNNPYYHITCVTNPPSFSPLPSYEVRAPILLIIDKHNGSAALDFIDELKAMNHPLILIGETTGSDRLYIDIRTVNLPSEKGTLGFPMKVYRNRKRSDKQAYQPDIPFDTSNSESLKTFIKETKSWMQYAAKSE